MKDCVELENNNKLIGVMKDAKFCHFIDITMTIGIIIRKDVSKLGKY